MGKNQTKEIKFINKILTPQNPKDIYYINVEDAVRKYLMLALIGCLLVVYFIIS